MRSRADVDASEALSRAKKEADSIIDDAAREAAARREEAEAYFEKQRATAAASAADFERTLGERRERASAEFTAQMAKQDQALAAVQERADLLSREAEEDRQAKATEAARVLENARAEAGPWSRRPRSRPSGCAATPSAARRGDRPPRQHHRPLSNVRNMLGTLGGGAALRTFTDARVQDEAPAPPPTAPAEEAPVDEVPVADEAPVASRRPPREVHDEHVSRTKVHDAPEDAAPEATDEVVVTEAPEGGDHRVVLPLGHAQRLGPQGKGRGVKAGARR